MPAKHNTHHHSHILQPKRAKDVDMTQGNIVHHIISFAFPLLIGNLFQQLYNMVDTWVVGNYVGNEAFSAVGTVGPITNMLIGFFWVFPPEQVL
jgi:Na+-driven multidrug efflux pump